MPANHQQGIASKLEVRITEQNLLINDLQQALEFERKKVLNLTSEFESAQKEYQKEVNVVRNELAQEKNYSKHCQFEINSLKKALEKHKNNVEFIQNSAEKDFDLRQQQITKEIKASYDAEMANLKDQYNVQLKNLKLNETFYENQIQLLIDRIQELYELDVNHDVELKASRQIYEKQLEELKQNINSIKEHNRTFNYPEQINILNEKLALSHTNEAALKLEINKYIKATNLHKEEINKLNNQLILSTKVQDQLKEELNCTLLELEKQKHCCKDLQRKIHEIDIDHNAQLTRVTESREALINSHNNDMIHLVNAFTPLHKAICSLTTSESKKDDTNSTSGSTLTGADNDSETNQCTEDLLSRLLEKFRKTYSEVEKLGNRYFALYKDNEELYQENEMLRSNIDECKQIYQEQIDLLEKEIEDFKIIYDVQENSKDKETVSKEESATPTKSTSQLQKDAVEPDQTAEENLLSTPTNESFDYNLQKQNAEIGKFMLQGATSTPFPSNALDLQAGGEAMLSPNLLSMNPAIPSQNLLSPVKNQSPLHLSLLGWIEHCQNLDKQNKELIKKIENLELKLKDTEFGANILKEEMANFEVQSQQLQKKIEDYSDVKRNLFEAIDQKNVSELKIINLQEQVKSLEDDNKKLAEENLANEEKCKNYLIAYKEAGVVDSTGMTETLLTHFNEKIKEVVLLKGEVRSLLFSKNRLLERVDKLTEVKNLYIIKIEQISRELCLRKEELEDVFQEKIKLSSRNKILEKEAEVLNLRVNYLTNLRDNNWGTDSPVPLVEKMQKELFALCKQVIEQKLELENSLMEKQNIGEFQQELDARHQFQIIKKFNQELQSEKEALLQRLIEQQEIIHSYQKNEGCDEGWLLHIESLEKEILQEIKHHKEQYARIEEALRSTGNLLNDLQLQKDCLRVKNQEIARTNKKLEEEKFKLRKAEMQLQLLQNNLEQKEALIKDHIEEKKVLDQNLKIVQSNLADAELKLSYEQQNNQWNKKNLQLQEAHKEVEKDLNLLSDEKDKTFCESQLQLQSSFLKQAETEYKKALERIKFYYDSQFATNLSKQQEDHKNQIEKLNEIIRQQALNLENAVEDHLVNLLPKKIEDRHKLSFKELLDMMEKFKHDVQTIESGLNDSEAKMFRKLKTFLEENFNCQILLARKILKEEHNKQYEISLDTAKQLHREEILLLKLQHEADKCKELFEKVEDSCNKQDEHRSVKQFTSGNYLDSEFLNHFNLLILNGYFNSIEKFLSNWNLMYQKQIKLLRNNLEKGFMLYNKTSEKDEKLKDIIECNDRTFLAKQNLIEYAKEFLNCLKSFKKSLIEDVKIMVTTMNSETQKCFDSIKEKHGDINDFLILQDKLHHLQDEKDKLEKQHRSAINLLKSDHEAEVAKTNKLLTDLKHFCEGGCNTSALLSFRTELEEKHRKEVEELRMYFEKKCADLEKNFSEEVFSQHSRKMSFSSSCSESELVSDHLCDVGGSGDNKLINLTNEKPKVRMPLLTSSDWEEMLLEEMGTSLTWKTINKVKAELVSMLRDNLDSCYIEKIKQLSNNMDSQHLKVLGHAANQEKKIIILQEKINRLKHVLTKNVAKEDLDKIEQNAVENFLNDLLAFLPENKNLLKSKYHLDSVIDDLDHVYSKKYKEMMNNQSENYIKELNEMKSNFEKQVELKTECIKGQDTSSAGFQEIVKERDNLRLMQKTLMLAISQLSNYLSNSEDELIKAITSEMANICQESPPSPTLRADWQDNSTRHNDLSAKKLNFVSNLSMLIKELDETMLSDSFDNALDETSTIRQTLESCLNKLKEEAVALLGLSKAMNPNAEQEYEVDRLNEKIVRLEEKNSQLVQQIDYLKNSLEKHQKIEGSSEILSKQCESVYDYSEYDSHAGHQTNNYLQNKARIMLLDLGQGYTSNKVMKILEEMTREGDNALEELQKEREDLQQQIKSADKQIKATRQFLEEQASEREHERDEFLREMSNLQNQLKEKGKECLAREMFSSEVDELNCELRRTLDSLEETKIKKDSVESELKAAIEKICVLREIITDLESQLALKNKEGSLLEQRLDDLEAEMEHQSGAQSLMAQELESLRNQSLDETCLNQLHELQEKQHFNSSHMRHFKIQIKDMEKLIDDQTKELEALNVATSTNSLSSPSEEISLREHLDCFRSTTPELCPSPVGFPVDEVNKLHEKILKHARSDEVVIKKVRDQDIRIGKLTSYIEEIQAEHDILQKRVEKQMAQIAEANNKIDDLRHKADAAHVSANRDLIKANQDLKEEISELKQSLDVKINEVMLKEEHLKKAEEQISAQQAKISTMILCDQDVVDTLRLELAAVVTEKNKLEDILGKYKRERELIERSKGDIEVLNAILDDKNEDIEHLQHTLAMLQNQAEEEKSSKQSRNLRVSFAADVLNSSDISEESKLRDAKHTRDSLECGPGISKIFNFQDKLEKIPSPIAQSSVLPEHSVGNLSIQSNLSPEKVEQVEISFGTIDKLTLELAEKNEQINRMEKELKDFEKLAKDLENTKMELQMAVASIDEDKDYYEKQFASLTELLKIKEAELEQKERSLEEKEKEIVKITADVQACQNLLKKLQKKLKEAEALASRENENELQTKINELTMENNKLKVIKLQSDKKDEELKEIYQQLISEKGLSDKLQKEKEDLSRKNIFYTRRIEDLSKENEKLLMNLEASENKLDNFVSSVRNLKNELSTKGISDIKDNFEECEEIQNIQIEIQNLQTKINKTTAEKLEILQELEELKNRNDSIDLNANKEINRLNKKISELQETINKIRETNSKNITQFEEEINTLQKDINQCKKSEKSAIEKLQKAEADKEELTLKLSSIQKDVENIQTGKNSHNEFPNVTKESEVSEKEKLVDQTRSLEGQKYLVLENILMAKMEFVNELKLKISRLEEQNRELKEYKQELEAKLIRLERIKNAQQKTINQLNLQLQQQKNNNLTLELAVACEKATTKRLEDLIEEERKKSRSSQKDDIQLIENMRVRLKTLMENEMQLKTMIEEEKQKVENLEAQLNSIKIMEKYQSDSESENNFEDLLKEEKEKYNQVLIELERERLNNGDLQHVLTRERNALLSLKNNLHKVEQEKISLTAEVNSLMNEIRLEKNKRAIIENRIKAISSSQQNVNKELYEKTIETAHSVIKGLEEECADLKNHIQVQQQEENMRDGSYSPLLKQLSELNSTIERLLRERGALQSAVSQLKVERKDLEKEIENLKRITENPVDPHNLEKPKLWLHLDNRINNFKQPVLKESVFNFLNKCMHAESFRKSLAYQKRFLLVVIKGYQDAEKENLARLSLGFKHAHKKHTFKTISLVVVGIIKMSRLTETRKLRRLLTLRKITEAFDQRIVDYKTDEQYLPQAMKVPHSPPCRDRPSYLRSNLPRDKPTSVSSDYLACFDELQRRLNEVVHRAQS
ncbi:golgin subfamily B member 1-like isoform X2 [Cimex lectularius]|uniref:Pericentrin/AKAP-450 centrosomal targeting domain-containing protein n=1 Tax=Cimex lectularius TaxID=79782 RepID=A0A8I6RW85_CIMLE|nr:golgin subfamily B member 1-like isoform X2 [Cimex lectularius]